MTEILPGTAYTVRFPYGALSGKRFRDAVQYVKEAGGKFDATAKTWSVTLGPAGAERTDKCQSCVNGGRDGKYAHKRGEDGLCVTCHGTCQVTYRPEPPGLSQLRTLRDNYHAEITQS